MLSSTLWRALTTPVTYALLAVLIGTAIMQVKYVNKALQRFDSTQVIPVQFVMFTLSVIIGSAVLYRDFEKVEAENVVKFIGGCLLTFFGVFLITSGRPRNNDDSDDEDSEEEGEERIGLTNQDPTEEESQYSDGAPRNPSIRRRSKAGPILNGDSTNDDDYIHDSRRSSRVSFADPSARPKTPRMYSNSSYQPSIRLIPSDPPSEVVTGTEETPLLGNRWRNSSDELLRAARHPEIQSTISTPLLLSEEQTPSTDSLRPPAERSGTHANVHIYPSLQHGPAPPQADRPLTPSRHSISRMMPGPLLSPLSGGLSAVVADSLRRGALRQKSFKRPGINHGRSKSCHQRQGSSNDGAEDDLGTSPLEDSDAAQEVSKSLGNEGNGSDLGSRITRARSLSNTLGDLFRVKQQRFERPTTAGDEEAGPSGSMMYSWHSGILGLHGLGV